MPHTRSGSQQPLTFTKRTHRTPDPTTFSEVIILSSDDEDELPVHKKAKVSNNRAKKSAGNGEHRTKDRERPEMEPEVVEISSGEEDEEFVRQRKLVSELRKQLQKSQTDLDRYKKDCTKLRQDLKGSVKLSELDDSTSCEICTLKLWSPYILVCGHSFCESCLDDWFTTTLTQYMATHPHYNPRLNNPPRNAVHVHPQHRHLPLNTLVMMYPHIQQQQMQELQIQHQQGPGPSYTCPTCRSAVKSKPIEDFALKSLVRKVAGAGGESSPRKAIGGDPWSGFFRT